MYGVYGQLAKEAQAATNLREMLLEECASHAAERQSDQMLIAERLLCALRRTRCA